MSPFAYSNLTTSRDLTYGYIHIPPSQPQKQYLLFLHGFPSGSHDWRHQIAYFFAKGYGIIVPDCLGYGQSAKPLDTALYNGKGMAADIHDILKHEGIESVIGVAHDWGSFLLSRMVNYYSKMFTKLVFIDVGYSTPGRNLTEQTVKFVNQMVMEKMGYSVFGYFLFFKESDATEIMDAHTDSVQSLFHASDENIKKKYMGAEGGTRDWFSGGNIAPAPAYLSKDDQEYNRKFFSPENGGYGPSINWYKAQLADINDEDDRGIPEENRIIHQPTLLFQGKNFITAAADFPGQMKTSVPNLQVKTLDAGHWIMLERVEETNAAIEEFLKE